MKLIRQPKLTIDVAPCFLLRANRSLVGILHNNGLRHSALFYLLANNFEHLAPCVRTLSRFYPKPKPI
jgi:hypothetical protein